MPDSSFSYNFENKRVGVIGGGSSVIQIIPSLQQVPGTHLSCYIRSKTWISRPFGDVAMEKLGNETKCKSLKHYTYVHRLTSIVSLEQKARFARDPEYYLHFRTIIERDANSVHSLTLKDSEFQKEAREDFTALISERLAGKPHILKSLLPSFSVGCRRLTPGPGYLKALVKDNIDFVDTLILKAHATGLVLENREQNELDVLVCATGFQALAPPPFTVTGTQGRMMKKKFEPYAETYLSVATDGFPNYFIILGPNAAISTGILTMIIEITGDYIIKCIRKLQKKNILKMEVKGRRVKDFSRIINKYFKKTVYLITIVAGTRVIEGEETVL